MNKNDRERWSVMSAEGWSLCVAEGGHGTPRSGGLFNLRLGGQFDRFFHLYNKHIKNISIMYPLMFTTSKMKLRKELIINYITKNIFPPKGGHVHEQ